MLFLLQGENLSTAPHDKSTETTSVNDNRAAAITEEQVFATQAYQTLDAQTHYYQTQLKQIRAQGATGTPSARSERDSFATHYEDNLARLRNVENRMILGRLDFTDEQSIHIGRLTLRDAEKNVLLTDWRAPQSAAFYQATASHPMDISRRRHIQTRFREVIGVEDEYLNADTQAENKLNFTGEGALFAAMNKARAGKMGDIVATIQREQDQIIRAQANGVLVVQGGPGTGKTAVALHRAAYLLYTYRERFANAGVLIIGPSRHFLQYIDQVLPSLGETNVVATTIGELLPDYKVNSVESLALHNLKGAPIWIKVVKRSVQKILQKPLLSPVTFRISGKNIQLFPEDVAQAQKRALQTQKPHNVAREKYARFLVNLLAERLAKALEVELGQDDWLFADVASDPQVRQVLNRHWLPASPQWIWKHLLKWPELLAAVAPELTDQQRKMLYRPAEHAITLGDIAILDEFAEVLGELPSNEAMAEKIRQENQQRSLANFVDQTLTELDLQDGIVTSAKMMQRIADLDSFGSLAERAISDRTWTYAHIVVDEAQELTPMQWRMLIRRNPMQSMTIVGDLDQRVTGTTGSWETVLGPLAKRMQLAKLSVSYRTPQEILENAFTQMQKIGYPVAELTAARQLPNSLRKVKVANAELGKILTSELQQLRQRFDAEYGTGLGTIAVISTPDKMTEIAELLPTQFQQDRHFALLSAGETKGLEFDAVVLIDGDKIATTEPGNYYVALTRATKFCLEITTYQ